MTFNQKYDMNYIGYLFLSIHGTGIAPHSSIPPETYRYANHISSRGKGIIELNRS